MYLVPMFDHVGSDDTIIKDNSAFRIVHVVV